MEVDPGVGVESDMNVRVGAKHPWMARGYSSLR